MSNESKLLEIDKRVTILETELPIIKENINDIYDVVYETKEKLDKQNGTIPFISEQIRELVEEHREFAKKIDDYIIKTERIDFKTKILWAAGGLISSSIIYFVLKYIGL